MTGKNDNPPDGNLSADDDRRKPVDLDRRTYLQLAGATVVPLSATTGRDETASIDGPDGAGTDGLIGYGGLSAISDSVADEVASRIETPAESVAGATRIETDGRMNSFDIPADYDLFELTAAADTDLTVTFDGSDAVGGTVLGLFDSEGSVLQQVYTDADGPVFLPEQIQSEGVHYLQVAGLEGSAGTYALSLSTDLTTAAQEPYEGTAQAVPGRIQIEDFDVGGEGIAYHDTSEGNRYDTGYRNESVDIRETRDESGAYSVGVVQEGEWLEYTIDPVPGTYRLHVRVATERSDRQLAVTLDGEALATVDVPNTGDWYNWETVTVDDVTIADEGPQTLRLEALDSGIDLNWLEFEGVDNGPYGGTAWPIPGRVQAEAFDTGGEGVAYHDTSEGNRYDTGYRNESVDIRETRDESGTYNIGVFQDGEWLEYTVEPTPGTYDLRVRVATERSDRQLDVTLDGESLATVDIPNTGDWYNWETVTVENVAIETDSPSILRLEAVGSGIDFNWFEFERVEPQGPFGGTAAALPGRIQTENFDVGGEDIAYHDTSEGNRYDTDYRNESVDIRETRDESGDYNIGVFQDGEWLEYTVIPKPGTYDVHLRVATERSDRQLAVLLDDRTLGTVDIPNTGDWYNWETVTLSGVEVTADTASVLRLEAVGSGVDINWIEFESTTTDEPTTSQSPYGGSTAAVPGRTEAEDFDVGGEGVAYHDTSEGNRYDTGYRNESVDIRETSDKGGGYNVGVFQDGEWLEYTVEPTPGTYDLRVRVASQYSGRQLAVTLDGEALATVDVPNTGDWYNWQTVRIRNLSVTDSAQVLRFEAVGSGIDFNWFEFIESTESDYGELGYGNGEFGNELN